MYTKQAEQVWTSVQSTDSVRVRLGAGVLRYGTTKYKCSSGQLCITVHPCFNANPVTLMGKLGIQPGKVSCKSNGGEHLNKSIHKRIQQNLVEWNKSDEISE